MYKKRNDTKYSNAYKKIKAQTQKEQREASKHRYKKNERHIETTLNQSSVIYQ